MKYPMAASGNITSPSKRPPEGLQRAAERAREFAEHSRAENTLRAYRASWRDFEVWCGSHGLSALPALPETVVMYISDRADELKVGTLGHRLAAIATAHKLAGYSNPASKREEPLRSTWAGIRRMSEGRKTQKAPLLLVHLRAIMETFPDLPSSDVKRLRQLRDKALLLVGFAAALRRSEMVALRVEDLLFDDRGVRVHVASSKTDVSGEGEEIGVPATGTAICPVGALKAWLEAGGIRDGYVFRAVPHGGLVADSLSSRSVAQIVKKHAAKVGLDADSFGGHSLRAGLITQAAKAGVREVDIMRQSRHKSVPVLRQYVRKATVWEDNAAAAALG